jgi:hypothetical protein
MSLWKEKNMKSKIVARGLPLLLLLLLAGCATMHSAGHRFTMKGQVLEVSGDSAYLCIGSRDGAQIGQEYTVYRFVEVPHRYARPGARYSNKKEEAGKIKITEITDEHRAKAKILSGEVEVEYFVEPK